MHNYFMMLGSMLLLGLNIFFMGGTAEACTTILVTKGASADGSTYVTHSNDSYGDSSIVYVPAKDHPAGSMRPVYPTAIAWKELPEYECYLTPRLVAAERAPGYAYADKARTKKLGEIPEAVHTYAYLDSDYAIMNECGLMMGECTDNACIENMPIEPGKGIFYSSELGRVALERCRTAREAINLMGGLIDEYGLYGTGETLLVADGQEGWVMEMQPTPSGLGGFWAAQRVPDGEFFVAANQFRIRELSKDNPDQIFNTKLLQALDDAGWAVYNENSGKLDWLLSMQGKEDYHPYFSQRRVWRAMSLAAPSLELPSKLHDAYDKTYPFAARPDKPLTAAALMDIHRDTYTGTDYDMKQGEGAGLFGSPYRYGKGMWERSINCRITGYTWITQNSPGLPQPVTWVSFGSAAESTFVPLAVAEMPAGYEQVDVNIYDPSKIWWKNIAVSELVQGYYSCMINDVQTAAHQQENKSAALLAGSGKMSSKDFAACLRKNAGMAADTWEKLYGTLLAHYNQGNNIVYAPGHEPVFPDIVSY